MMIVINQEKTQQQKNPFSVHRRCIKPNSSSYALFVLVMTFSRKRVIFQKVFLIKLSYFPMFGSNFKWVEKQLLNFPYLACYKI